MMPSDPRLQNVQLLTLAAYRLQQRQQRAVPDWRTSVGMSSLLEAARHLPRREPWDLPTVDETSGLGKLLAEARQWEKEHTDGP
jgi:hypothetical protein